MKEIIKFKSDIVKRAFAGVVLIISVILVFPHNLLAIFISVIAGVILDVILLYPLKDVLFYDDYFLVRRSISSSTKEAKYQYSDIIEVFFQSSYRGENLIVFKFKINTKVEKIVYGFPGYTPLKELSFLKSKGVSLRTQPIEFVDNIQ